VQADDGSRFHKRNETKRNVWLKKERTQWKRSGSIIIALKASIDLFLRQYEDQIQWSSEIIQGVSKMTFQLQYDCTALF
jgi:hypothetical protein